jgi:hypothetical protein
VDNFYKDPKLKKNPPAEPDVTKLTRHIRGDWPRVTKFNIQWDKENMLAVSNESGDLNTM